MVNVNQLLYMELLGKQNVPFLSVMHLRTYHFHQNITDCKKLKAFHAFGNAFTDDSLHEGDREKHFVVVLDILTKWDKQRLRPVTRKEALKQMNPNEICYPQPPNSDDSCISSVRYWTHCCGH